MARRNGRDLDGSAIIASVSEIDNLFSKGYITKTTRPLNDVLRYSICPVIQDPRDGGIARDQFLAYTRNPDGSARARVPREFREPADHRKGIELSNFRSQSTRPLRNSPRAALFFAHGDDTPIRPGHSRDYGIRLSVSGK
jgi:hypothetical protein